MHALTSFLAIFQLEYFSRPLGLWKTSGKLAHTVSEVAFICAWSAALSLSFDNYFTSILNCSSTSSTNWWNELGPSQAPPGLQIDAGLSKNLCLKQRELISLVFIGLVFYCGNLVISLFRIFEKVKYHRSGSTTV